MSLKYKKGNHTFNCKLDEPTLLDRDDQVIHERLNTEEQKIDHSPIDCQWDDWRIGECSKTCGGGQRLNIRNRKIEAANGGKDCLGRSTETVGCYEGDCPGKSFHLKMLKMRIRKNIDITIFLMY